jgi:hypothetical protein
MVFAAGKSIGVEPALESPNRQPILGTMFERSAEKYQVLAERSTRNWFNVAA